MIGHDRTACHDRTANRRAEHSRYAALTVRKLLSWQTGPKKHPNTDITACHEQRQLIPHAQYTDILTAKNEQLLSKFNTV